MNAELLRKKMKSLNVRQDHLAKLLGMSASSFSKRMNNKVYWKATEVISIMRELRLSNKEFESIFMSEEIEARK